ncbi:MAG TPA: deoxynucleoside kinase [Clostridiales bacterium]|nr:deoxynucleoside kinase [Clostridiales bacterium]HQK73168.1 deoxynucleoside kinase [Clostridiales bacterium]
MAGKLVVIEGLDGSGKSTQTQRLEERLSASGLAVKRIKLPNYEDQSSALVQMYLAGRFGSKPEDVNVYAASSFFAVDRFVSYHCYWKEDYLAGKLIVSDRYTTSNAYHQAIKLPKEKWTEYFAWLEDFEYVKIGIPKPDLVVFLDMPVSTGQQLMSARYHGEEIKKDIHEKNTDYLDLCYEAADLACRVLGWRKVSCCEGGRLLPIEAIADRVYDCVSKGITEDA